MARIASRSLGLGIVHAIALAAALWLPWGAAVAFEVAPLSRYDSEDPRGVADETADGGSTGVDLESRLSSSSSGSSEEADTDAHGVPDHLDACPTESSESERGTAGEAALICDHLDAPWYVNIFQELVSDLSQAFDNYDRVVVLRDSATVPTFVENAESRADLSAAATGARYISFYPAQYGGFVDAWNDGESFEEALDAANNSASRTVIQAHLKKPSPAGSARSSARPTRGGGNSGTVGNRLLHVSMDGCGRRG